MFAQPAAATTRSQLREVVGLLDDRFPKAAEILAAAEADVSAYASFPRAHWRKIASTNPLERVNKEIKRRSNVVGIFPDDASVIRLVGAVLVDQHDEWPVTDRRYLSEESMNLIDQPRRTHPPRTPRRVASPTNTEGHSPHFHHATGHGRQFMDAALRARGMAGTACCPKQLSGGWHESIDNAANWIEVVVRSRTGRASAGPEPSTSDDRSSG